MLSLLAAEVYLRPAVEANLIDRIRGDLFARLALVDDTGSAADRPTSTAGRRGTRWPTSSGRAPRGRVTLHRRRRRGARRLARSRCAALAQVENHRDRPEVAAALAGRPGRRPATAPRCTSALMYVAVPLTLPGGARGAARLAVPLDEVDAAVRRLRRIFWARARRAGARRGGRLSSAAAQMLSRALRRMTEAARRMAAGDLGGAHAPGRQRRDRRAGTALDAMAGSLAADADHAARRARSAGRHPGVDAGGGAGARQRAAACCWSTRRCASMLALGPRGGGAGRARADPQRRAAVDPGDAR